MDVRCVAALGVAIVMLAGCQTSTAAKTDDAVMRVAGLLQAVPIALERCEGFDPNNRTAYADERARYVRDSNWIADATYKVLTRRISSTRQGIEAFVRGVAEKRVDEVIASGRTAGASEACVRLLAKCRLRDVACQTLDQSMPEEVRLVIDEAAR